MSLKMHFKGERSFWLQISFKFIYDQPRCSVGLGFMSRSQGLLLNPGIRTQLKYLRIRKACTISLLLTIKSSFSEPKK